MNKAKFEEAIYALQDGNKIKQKRIADYMGVSSRTIRRYMSEDFELLIQKYNASIKSIKTRSKKRK